MSIGGPSERVGVWIYFKTVNINNDDNKSCLQLKKHVRTTLTKLTPFPRPLKINVHFIVEQLEGGIFYLMVEQFVDGIFD